MLLLLGALVFLGLSAEVKNETFSGHWSTFMRPISDLLFSGVTPLRISLWHVLIGTLFVLGLGRRPGTRAAPFVRSLHAQLFAIGVMFVWGLARGGDLRLALFQTQQLVMMSVMAFVLMAFCTRPAHFVTLGKFIVAAGLYRVIVAILFYAIFIRTGAVTPIPEYMTSHHDTVLFVTALAIVIGYAFEKPTPSAIGFAAVTAPLLVYAIRINGRRLAYVSAAGALLVFFFLLRLRGGRPWRRLVALAILATPLLVAYFAVGWGRTEAIFKPAQVFSSIVGEHENVSTQMRNIENYNLIATLKGHLLLGTGWGHPYDEISKAYDISTSFPQYRYVPHNSVLGLLAFTGLLGFTAAWLPLPLTAYLTARTYRAATDPLTRAVAAVAAMEVFIYISQMYGDMGMGSWPASILMAVALAAAGRLSVASGAFPAKAPGTTTQR